MIGLVIRTQSGFFTVKSHPDHQEVPCRLRGRLLKGRRMGDVVAVGDRVEFTLTSGGRGVIEFVEPRKSQISRQAPESKERLPANFDRQSRSTGTGLRLQRTRTAIGDA